MSFSIQNGSGISRWYVPLLAPLLAAAALGCGNESQAPTVPERLTGDAAPAPAAAAILSFRSLSAHAVHTCGITTTDRAYCWGDGGGLGDGTQENRLAPAAVVGGLAFSQVSVGIGVTCALRTDDHPYCWNASPAPVAGGRRFKQLSRGAGHTCAVNASGVVFCWGENSYGQLGDGTTTPRPDPVRVQIGTLRFRQVSAGALFTCGVTVGNRAYCWGYNGNGELGDGTTTQRLKPVAVSRGLSIGEVRTGISHTCGATTDDRAYCWGSTRYGVLGDGSSGYAGRKLKPVAVLGGLRLRSLSLGSFHTCGVTTDNAAYCWGNNTEGQLGNGAIIGGGSTPGRTTPDAVAGGHQFIVVGAASGHTCGVTTDHRAYCWGRGGRLGDGTTNSSSTPEAVVAPQ